MSSKYSTGASVNDSSIATKLTMLAALGLLVGYGSYQLSKNFINTRRKNEKEEKKADYKDQKLKRMEI